MTKAMCVCLAMLFTVSMALCARLGLGEDRPKEDPVKKDTPANPVTDAEKRALAEAINGFAVDLYGKLSDKPGNLFISPYSISTALAMTYGGARENTAAEMAKVLHLDAMGERAHDVCGALIADLNGEKGPDGKPRGFELAVANRLFGQKGIPFLAPFLALTKDRYGAELEAVDFAADAEGACKHINEWVEGKTRNRIKNLITQLSDSARLVLVNAIYFKGNWAAKFDAKATRSLPFHTSEDKSIQAWFMGQQGHFAYREFDGRLQVLELTYAGLELSMLVLLPDAKWGLAGLEKDLTAANWATWTKGLKEEKVDVFLPKFKQTWGTTDLVEPLQALGMKDAFESDRARFEGITAGTPGLLISQVLHKTFVEVNEEGTEAAGATAVAMDVGAPPPPHEPVVFRADRPFLYAIRHNESGTILFLGRMTNPSIESRE